MRFCFYVGLAVIVACMQACSGAGGLSTGSGNTFETISADAMGIDDIVTDASYPVVAPMTASIFPFHLLAAAGTAEYYHGRFLYNDGGAITVGRMSFKVVKNSASTAYFAEWTIHRIVQISDPQTFSATLTADADEEVPAAYDGTNNHIGIRNEFKRQITFKVNFVNNDYFLDIDKGSAIMSEDYKTMVGGDGSKLFFIATRQTSAPAAVDNDDLIGSWGAFNMFPTSSGSIREGELSSDTYDGITFDIDHGNVVDFNALNGDLISFTGEAKLIDSDVGVFIYAEDDLGVNLSSVDGVIFIAPAGGLLMRFDLVTDDDIFACDKFN